MSRTPRHIWSNMAVRSAWPLTIISPCTGMFVRSHPEGFTTEALPSATRTIRSRAAFQATWAELAFRVRTWRVSWVRRFVDQRLRPRSKRAR